MIVQLCSNSKIVHVISKDRCMANYYFDVHDFQTVVSTNATTYFSFIIVMCDQY